MVILCIFSVGLIISFHMFWHNVILRVTKVQNHDIFEFSLYRLHYSVYFYSYTNKWYVLHSKLFIMYPYLPLSPFIAPPPFILFGRSVTLLFYYALPFFLFVRSATLPFYSVYLVLKSINKLITWFIRPIWHTLYWIGALYIMMVSNIRQ